jgi:hypothetical protein
LAVVLAAVGALALAGCGFTGNSSEAASSGSESPAAAADFLKFSQCMRTHGVPNFPDPTGRGIQLSRGSGIDPASPAFQSAQKTCSKLLPGGGAKPAAAPAPSASDLHTALVWADCVRKHGVPNFPDPSTTAQAGLSFRGVVFPVGPEFNIQSPAFKQAQAACGFGPGGGKGPAGNS